MLGQCPHCGSARIRRRYRRHRYNNWRCRRCNRVFARPKTESPVQRPTQRPTQSPAQGYPQPAAAPKYTGATSGANATFGAAAGASARQRPRKRKILPIAALAVLIAAIGLFVLAQVDPGDTPRQQPIVAEAQNVAQPLGVAATLSPALIPTETIAGNTASASIPPTPNAQAATDANIRATPAAISVQSAAAATPTSTYTPTPSSVATATLSPALIPANSPEPTSTLIPTSTPTHTSTPEPTSTPTPTFTPTDTPTPTYTPEPTPTPTPTLTPTDTPTPTPIPPPHLRHIEEKQYMLTLINAERRKAGVQPVELGDNIAAQLHAEAALENCFSSHWGIDGLKPYMRYSLAGGYQANAENGHGLDYCIKASDNYASLRPIKSEITDAMLGWMRSGGHRQSILDNHFHKVNIGLAWDRYNLVAFQHFESDYVVYDQLPDIDSRGRLSMSGGVRNGAQLSVRDLAIVVDYDQPPHALTRGQVSRTYCYGTGMQVAALREPLSDGWSWTTDEFTTTHDPCPDPYDVPASARPARSADEAGKLWDEAYKSSLATKATQIVVPWITAKKWRVSKFTFSIEANLSKVLRKHGDGVYTVVVWGKVDGEDVVVSEYSIFVGVTPPDTYSP